MIKYSQSAENRRSNVCMINAQNSFPRENALSMALGREMIGRLRLMRLRVIMELYRIDQMLKLFVSH